jgi:ketosteroid isomerase-like protein
VEERRGLGKRRDGLVAPRAGDDHDRVREPELGELAAAPGEALGRLAYLEARDRLLDLVVGPAEPLAVLAEDRELARDRLAAVGDARANAVGRRMSDVMSAEDVETVRRFRTAVSQGDRDAAADLLVPDVEWRVLRGETLRGGDAVWRYYTRLRSSAAEHLDAEFERSELEGHGDGRVSTVSHQVWRWKETGAVAYERRVLIEYTVRDGRIARYEATVLEE